MCERCRRYRGNARNQCKSLGPAGGRPGVRGGAGGCVRCTGVVTGTARCTPPPVECQPPSGTQPPRTTSYNTTVAVTHNISCSRWSLFGKRQKNICDYWISWLLSRWRGELWRWWHHQEACPCDDSDTVIMPAQPDQAEWGGLNIILLLPQWRSRISHQLSISLLRGPCPTAQSR